MSIEAMKQALEALECLFGIPEQFTGKGGGDVAVWTLGGSYRAQQAIPVLRQAIEQAEKQEPVAWRFRTGTFWNREVHWRYVLSLKGTEGLQGLEPLYTHPQPQREWVGLTDEEIKPLCDENYIIYGAYAVDFIQSIEAKLKEKNT